ncbi:hypothetical protein [Kitasatospora camelliae]|uniref:ATP-grasp target RiPP n=1 Tax=Kitasatospora camelliae TaxID=3156397 RepID=A0AAU8K6I7_9ACTN
MSRRPRLWDGLDNPYGPDTTNPQPSRPTPNMGAPYIAPATPKETPTMADTNQGLTGSNYGPNQPLALPRDPFPVNEVLVKDQPAPAPQPKTETK